MRPDSNQRPLSLRELYEFDLAGYVIIRGFLPKDLVDRMNEIIDRAQAGQFRLKFPFLELDPVFLDLMSHSRVMAICEEFLGKWFRVDNIFGRQNVPPLVGCYDRQNLHAGPFANQGCFQYAWYENRPHCGALEFAYAMDHVEPGDGGLVLVPGSHKQNIPLEGRRLYKEVLNERLDAWWIHNPALDPGDLLIFTEAVVHGTMHWKPKDRRRRNLYYKYIPGCMVWRDYEEMKKYLPLARNQLERNLLRPPFVGRYNENNGPLFNNQWRTPTVPDSLEE